MLGYVWVRCSLDNDDALCVCVRTDIGLSYSCESAIKDKETVKGQK